MSETLRKFDGQPLTLEPTTLISFSNGDLGCDTVLTTAPLTFTTKEMARAYIALSLTASKVRPLVLGVDGVREMVAGIPAIKELAIIADLGSLHFDANGKRQRALFKVYAKRDAFLGLISA